MTQPTQEPLFKTDEAKNAETEFKAATFIWNYFFEEHGLMLLDEHITEIAAKIEEYKAIKNNLTTSTDIPY